MKFTIPFDCISCPRPSFNLTTGKQSRVYLGRKYMAWRYKFNNWFENWLESTNYQLVTELTTLPNRDNNTSPRLPNGNIRYDFYGFNLKVGFFARPIKDHKRLVPVTSRVYDIDNGLKALIDGIFQSETFKYKKIDDRYINKLSCFRRYSFDEPAHIDVDLSLITL